MFQDAELEELYSQLDKLCNPQPRNTNSVKEITTILSSNQAISNSSSLKELESLIKDLENEEKLEMRKTDLFLKNTGSVEIDDNKKEEETTIAQSNKFVGKAPAANGIFSNLKHNVRQSNKKRIEAYANTNAKVVRESSMEPLKLQRYTEK